jgi:hypothetical protein
MSNFNKQKLLESMVNIAPGRGTAENESNDHATFLKNFLPLPNYRQALEKDALLILGGRGVGKTELFRLLAIPSGRVTLVESLNIRALPDLNKTIWIAAFGRTQQKETTFPVPEIVEAQMQNADNIDWRVFWVGLMLGIMLRQNEGALTNSWADIIPLETRQLLIHNLPYLSAWFPLIRPDIEKINSALDLLDKKLIEADKWLFVTYDELDTLVTSYNKLADPIRELLAFWLDRRRRWERIIPKIFLRTDLFRDEFLSFPDASKLKLFSLAAGRRLEKFSVLDLDEDKLLEPSDLQGALVDTSNDRISELAEEYPWLEPLKRSLNGLKVPVEAEIFMNKLQQTHWIQQPPTSKPEEVMEYLRQPN